MKCVTVTILAVSIIFVLSACGPSTTEARPSALCTSRLLASLQRVCEARGTKSMKMMYYSARYGRSMHYYRQGRAKRYATDTAEAKFSEGRGLVSSIVKAGAVINPVQKEFARTRQPLYIACCDKPCDDDYIETRFCPILEDRGHTTDESSTGADF